MTFVADGGGEVPLFSTHPVCACHATFVLLDSSLLLNAFSVFSFEECINQGKDVFLVDPDPNLLYTKQKRAKQNPLADENISTCSAVVTVVSSDVCFPENGWGNRLEKMPLFTKAEMNRFIENSGKRLGKSNHSVPTSWKKGKTFLEVS